MKHMLAIQEKVREAMLGACNDMHEFIGSPSKRIDTEYLFTVNVAKAISKLNDYPADPYRIFLEKGTKEFARDCLNPVVFGHSLKRGSTIFRKEKPNSRRNGRIDVAVYKNGYFDDGRPLCAIELKAFNPPRKLVIDDLKRNLEYFRISGVTGNGALEFAIFAAFHAFTKHEDERQVQCNERETKKRYEKWLSELGRTDDVSIDIETFTVSKELLGEVVNEVDHQVLDTSVRHHFVGVIVRFSSRSK
jgi:hypothetical protein